MPKKPVLALLLLLVPLNAVAFSTDDLLALVAMPLAVAAVAEIADVPVNELIDVVTLLNDANVPPVQFVEVVRYVPVAITADEDREFVEFVRSRFQAGVTGDALVTVIGDRYVTFGLRDIDLRTPRVVVVDEDFVPAIVRTRVADARRHPHGGPPGQLKKIAGVQTGAEIVHGSKPGRRGDDRPASIVIGATKKGKGPGRKQRDVVVGAPSGGPPVVVVDHGRGPGKNKGGNSGGPPPHAQGAGKGKSKGKG